MTDNTTDREGLQALVDAGDLHGLIIAAVRAYSRRYHGVPPLSAVVVFDFGSGESPETLVIHPPAALRGVPGSSPAGRSGTGHAGTA